MKPEDIRAAIVRAGTTQRAIADYLDVRPQTVARVINGQSRSAKIEDELAKITGKPIHASRNKPGRRKSVWNGVVEAVA
ncbi:helix-turn-helix domain-containing protein [Hydrogenophaga taeniospiralis]|uniref:helix-turn-helix domain-containing protein n=1 Tax=Hydrogenophaga taeniospiralis TaxID=65656 RepID=UPI001CFA3811|nr:helix-turn-helix transcriptional regulator [Hydrogenophaga taeniospiralis]UCU93994.1 helix-turn-helix transcriptional regulator [Hydrogenophaga taeniospiralis]